MKKILSAILCCTFILAMISCGNGASSSGNEASSSGNEASSSGNEASSSGNEASSSGNEASSSGNEASSSGNEASSKYVKMAEGINKNLPMETFKGVLRFDKTEAASKNEFKFYYTFLIDPGVSADDEFVKSAKKRVIPSFKAIPEINVFADDNMTLICIYNKADGSKFAELKITPDEYR